MITPTSLVRTSIPSTAANHSIAPAASLSALHATTTRSHSSAKPCAKSSLIRAKRPSRARDSRRDPRFIWFSGSASTFLGTTITRSGFGNGRRLVLCRKSARRQARHALLPAGCQGGSSSRDHERRDLLSMPRLIPVPPRPASGACRHGQVGLTMRPKHATKSRPYSDAGDRQPIRCRSARAPSGRRLPCRVSTVVVQRFCKPKVGGSNPSPGIRPPLRASRCRPRGNVDNTLARAVLSGSPCSRFVSA